MFSKTRAVCIGCRVAHTSSPLPGVINRYASTTSAIKSGLRAESVGRREGRSRFGASSRDAASPRSFEHRNGAGRAFERQQERPSQPYEKPRRPKAALNDEHKWRKDGQDGYRNRRERRKEWFGQYQADKATWNNSANDAEMPELVKGRDSVRSNRTTSRAETAQPGSAFRSREREHIIDRSSRHGSASRAQDQDEVNERPRPSRSGRVDAYEPDDTQRFTMRKRADTKQPRSNMDSAKSNDDIPIPIRYTTASSQFVYGANVVFAALQAQTRKIYHLYMHKRAEADNIAHIRRLASSLDIEITRTTDAALLDKLSEGRPHNGVVLEVSPIPARPVKQLGPFYEDNKLFKLSLHEQSAEDAAVNGKETTMRGFQKRAPLILFLDGITDPGNVGNIIRSAHFFGADAVAIATQTCAPLSSPVLAKASAGACEAIPIFAVPRASEFVFGSRKAGWTICAAVAPTEVQVDTSSEDATIKLMTTSDLSSSRLADTPTIVVLGAEGEGLRESLLKKANVLVTIERGVSVNKVVDSGVDSLNVATAAAVLLNAFVAGQNKHAAAIDAAASSASVEA